MSAQIKKIFSKDIQKAVALAHTLKKRRVPILLNKNFDEIPQVFINCLLKKTYIRPHKHQYCYQLERFSVIQGEAIVLIFDDTGIIIDKFTISQSSVVMVEIPYNVYHTVFTTTGCALLEIRNHAYNQSIDKEFAMWSPHEDDCMADVYYNKLIKANKGDICVIE